MNAGEYLDLSCDFENLRFVLKISPFNFWIVTSIDFLILTVFVSPNSFGNLNDFKVLFAKPKTLLQCKHFANMIFNGAFGGSCGGFFW